MMRLVFRIILIIVITVFCTESANAQYLNFAKSDSLYKELERTDGKERVNVLIALADELGTSSLTDAIQISRSAIDISGKLGFTEELIKAYISNAAVHYAYGDITIAFGMLDSAIILSKSANNYLLTGNAYLHKSEIERQLEQYADAYFSSDSAAKYYAKVDYLKGILDVYVFRGRMFMMNNQYDEALQYFSEAETKAKEGEFPEFSATLLHCIGFCYYKKGDYSTALLLFDKSLEENTKSGDFETVISTYNFLGEFNTIVKGDYKKSLENYFDGIKVSKNRGLNGYLSTFYTKVSHSYMVMGDFNKAREFNQIALDIRIQTGTKYLIGSAYINIGATYFKEGNYFLAEEYYTKGLPLLIETDRIFLIRHAYLKLAQVYEKLKDSNKALASLKMYVAYSDSVDIQDEKAKLSKYRLKYELEKKNSEIKAAELERKTKESVFYLLIIVLLLVTILVIILRIISDRKQKNKLKGLNVTLEEIIKERTKDLEELKSAKEKAEESDRLKTAFLASISHEIRTPMNSIIGFSDLLSYDKNLSEIERSEFSDIIKRRGKDLLEIIDDIIDVSIIESGDVKIVKSVCRINQIFFDLFSAFDNHRISIGKKKIVIEMNLVKDDKFIIITDGLRLRQILSNLLDNSLKFTDTGSIKFGYDAPEDGFMKFFVKDSGIGIPEDKSDIIFDRFRQIDDSHTREYGGTGLGLTISKKLIELLGGKIWFNSEPCKGSEFYFTLPALSVPDITERMDNDIINDPSELDWKGKTILIVEDDGSNYRLINALIQKTKAEIVYAVNGREAVDIYSSDNHIDMILMDMRMPVMDGFEATREIRKKSQSVPIIALTAFVMPEDYDKCIKAGCDDHISKPFSINALFSTIRKYIKEE